MGRTLNPDSLIGHDLNRVIRASKTIFLVTAQIHFVIASGDCKRLREFSRTGTKPVQIMNSTPPSHQRNPASRFHRPNQDKTVLLSFHQNVQHPVNAVAEINVGRAGPVPLDKRARAGTNETMRRFVTDRMVSFCLNDNTSAAIPIQLAADKLARTSHWIAPKKICAKHFAAHGVRASGAAFCAT
jgi:hypothetical protein